MNNNMNTYPKKNILITVQILISILAIGFMFYIINTNSKGILYDEANFLPNLRIFLNKGLSQEFLLKMRDQSPGPLYQIVHYFFYYFTRGNIIQLRLLNLYFFIAILFINSYILKLLNKSPFETTNIFAVPMIFVIAALALTEIPSMLCISISICCIILALYKCKAKPISFIFSIIGGQFLGLAIAGRMPFLMVIPAICVLFFYKNISKQYLISYILSSLIFPIYLILTWKGLVPPHVQTIQAGFNIFYGIMALAYASVCTLLINYKWFILKYKYFNVSLIVVVILFSIINELYIKITYIPIYAVSSKHLPPFILKHFALIVPAFCMGIACLYLFSFFINIWKHRTDSLYIFFAIATLLIIATCIKSSAQFSSRYVAQAGVFMTLGLSMHTTINWSKIITYLISLCIGFISLYSYFNQ